jgi:hypothetical protein
MVDWWPEIEHGIVECLGSGGAMSPGELGHRIGISLRRSREVDHLRSAGVTQARNGLRKVD